MTYHDQGGIISQKNDQSSNPGGNDRLLASLVAGRSLLAKRPSKGSRCPETCYTTCKITVNSLFRPPYRGLLGVEQGRGNREFTVFYPLALPVL